MIAKTPLRSRNLLYLCCDLGGTTADWAVYDSEEKEFVLKITLMTSAYEDFYLMMEEFLISFGNLSSRADDIITNTTLAVAGPINGDSVNPTNLPGWEINTTTVDSILEDYGHKGYSSLINDFEALGYGVLFLFENGFKPEDTIPVYGRFRSAKARVGVYSGTRSLVCGPGTGLGVASLVDGLLKDGFPYIISSEGGHHSLSPETPEQYRFLSDNGAFNGKQSYEDALSHDGLRNMYNFFRRSDYAAEPNFSIHSKEILQLATTGKDQAAVDAIELFCELLANFCGNTVLTFNCDKTVFLWGGTLKEMPLDLLKARFSRYYKDRCNHSGRVSRVPVVLIANDDLPLLGCVHRSMFECEYLMNKEE